MARMRGIHADVIRGSIGGNTFFANQFHQILIRQRTSPVNPSTTAQTQIRSAISGASGLYDNLTQAQKVAWDNYADTLAFPNPLGPITVPGRQVAVGNLGFREYCKTLGESFTGSVNTAPTVSGFLTISNITIVDLGAPGTGFGVSVYNPNPETIKVMYQLSPQFGSGRFRYKGPWVHSTTTFSDINTVSSGVEEFEVGSDGDIYFVRLRAVSEEDEVRLSAESIVRAVVRTTT